MVQHKHTHTIEPFTEISYLDPRTWLKPPARQARAPRRLCFPHGRAHHALGHLLRSRCAVYTSAHIFEVSSGSTVLTNTRDFCKEGGEAWARVRDPEQISLEHLPGTRRNRMQARYCVQASCPLPQAVVRAGNTSAVLRFTGDQF